MGGGGRLGTPVPSKAVVKVVKKVVKAITCAKTIWKKTILKIGGKKLGGTIFNLDAKVSSKKGKCSKSSGSGSGIVSDRAKNQAGNAAAHMKKMRRRRRL